MLAAALAVQVLRARHPSGTSLLLVLAAVLAAGIGYRFHARAQAAPADRPRTPPRDIRLPAPRFAAEPGCLTAGEVTVAATQRHNSADDLTGWSDAVLYRAWQVSYIRLRRLQRLQQYGGRGPAEVAQVAQVLLERGRYLDELERRHPAGFQEWVAGHAHSPGDAGPYPMPGAFGRGGPGEQPSTDLT